MQVKLQVQIINKNFLLVDDVHVGSSTTKKCAELLIENGARQVQIFCTAKTVYRG